MKEFEGRPFVAGSEEKRGVYEQAAQLSGVELFIVSAGKNTLFVYVDDDSRFPNFIEGIIKASGGIKEYAKATRPRHLGV